jgi:hypothetical protein
MPARHVYEVRPRKDHRGIDLISDALPFGRLWYVGPNAIENAIGYAKFNSGSHDAVIRVYDAAGNVIDTHEHTGDFCEFYRCPSLRELMPSLVYVLLLLVCCYFSSPSHRGSENMVAFMLISVAPRESVAFSFTVPNLSLKSFALAFSVF